MKYIDARILRAEANEKKVDGNTLGMIHQTITDGAASVNPSEPLSTNPSVSNFQAIHADQRNQNATYNLDSQVVEKLPGSSAVVQSTSANVYTFDAGVLPSSTSVITQDDSTPASPPKPTPTAVILPPTPVPGTGGSTITLQKPLRFANDSSYAATVVVSSYTPAPGVSAGRSNASTVVFPGGNSSAQLSLPLGEYVFCYYWDLSTDADNDGYVDYAHRSTGKVTLSETSPDRAESAQVVMLSPENASSPNGKCSQNQVQTQPTAAQRPTPQQPTATVGLTPQELANQGYHIYTYVLYDKNSLIYQRNTFDKDSVEIKAYNEVTNEAYSTNVYTKIDLNVYISLDGKSSITFTDFGYTFTIISSKVQYQYIRE